MIYPDANARRYVPIIVITHRAIPWVSALIAAKAYSEEATIIMLTAVAMIFVSLHSWFAAVHADEHRNVELAIQTMRFHNIVNAVGMLVILFAGIFSGFAWVVAVAGFSCLISWYATDAADKVGVRA